MWGDVSAVFPFDCEVIDKDLFELFHVFEWSKKGISRYGFTSKYRCSPLENITLRM